MPSVKIFGIRGRETSITPYVIGLPLDGMSGGALQKQGQVELLVIHTQGNTILERRVLGPLHLRAPVVESLVVAIDTAIAVDIFQNPGAGQHQAVRLSGAHKRCVSNLVEGGVASVLEFIELHPSGESAGPHSLVTLPGSLQVGFIPFHIKVLGPGIGEVRGDGIAEVTADPVPVGKQEFNAIVHVGVEVFLGKARTEQVIRDGLLPGGKCTNVLSLEIVDASAELSSPEIPVDTGIKGLGCHPGKFIGYNLRAGHTGRDAGSIKGVQTAGGIARDVSKSGSDIASDLAKGGPELEVVDPREVVFDERLFGKTPSSTDRREQRPTVSGSITGRTIISGNPFEKVFAFVRIVDPSKESSRPAELATAVVRGASGISL